MKSTLSEGGTKRERQERAHAIRQQQARRERRRALLVWVPVALILLGLAGAVVVGLRDARSEKAAGADLSAVKSYDAKSDHVTDPVEYEQTPPAGGPHNPIWLNCDTYTRPVPNENAVHSMEHGATWVTYDPKKVAGDDLKVLEESMPDSYGVLSPFPGLGNAVTASAWGKQLKLNDVNDPRLRGFIEQYTQSPNAPEPGAACSGGSDGTLPLNAGAPTQ